mgnify:CR=1 FL=1
MSYSLDDLEREIRKLQKAERSTRQTSQEETQAFQRWITSADDMRTSYSNVSHALGKCDLQNISTDMFELQRKQRSEETVEQTTEVTLHNLPHVLPIMGMKVMLKPENPEHTQTGIIMSPYGSESDVRRKIRDAINGKRQDRHWEVEVKWEDGQIGSENSGDLIQVGTAFVDLYQVWTNRDKYSYLSKESMEASLDQLLIMQGETLNQIVIINDEYRQKLFESEQAVFGDSEIF